MQVVHEFGHVVATWGTGGTVTNVVLHPLAISRTDVSPNPSPMIVVWGGPMIGIVLPLVIWAVMRAGKWTDWQLAQFFAGFCLLANGLYLGVGSFERIGDAGDMLRLGSPIWMLWLFGIVTAPLGLWMWHGLGETFGLGQRKGQVDPRLAYASAAMLLITVALELCFSSRL